MLDEKTYQDLLVYANKFVQNNFLLTAEDLVSQAFLECHENANVENLKKSIVRNAYKQRKEISVREPFSGQQQCNKCMEVKSVHEFYVHTQIDYNYSYLVRICKQCVIKLKKDIPRKPYHLWSDEEKELSKNRVKKYKDENRQKINAQQKEKSKREKENDSDWYCIGVISASKGISRKDVTQEMINDYREWRKQKVNTFSKESLINSQVKKECNRCHEEKLLREFQIRKKKGTGRYYPNYVCKACQSILKKEKQKNNPEYRAKSNSAVKEWKNRNPEKTREINNKKQQRHRNELSDWYVKCLLSNTHEIKNADTDIIELKRLQIQLNRTLRETKIHNT